MKHSLRTLVIAVVACASLAACSASQQPPAADSLVKLDVAYMPSNPAAVGYLVRPLKPGKLPTVILIHEWWGLNDNIKSLADKFAAEGYVALAVDLYDGKRAANADEAKVLAGAVRENTDKAFANLKAAVAYLKGSPSADPDRLAAVGWCFGGGWSYQMAKNDLGVKASVMYYGQFAPEDDLSMMKAHILGHFGEKDASISVDTVKEFQVKLKTLSGENAVFIYPNAGHGFAGEANATYDKTQADEAWARTQEFLKQQL
ncbi:MAG TPA: dienelactone hydrolase family protein [Candidatus Peribacteria bacterium]|nr:dienelactone hydrolase family protein [Candidatus Peribacteria bacterium]